MGLQATQGDLISDRTLESIGASLDYHPLNSESIVVFTTHELEHKLGTSYTDTIFQNVPVPGNTTIRPPVLLALLPKLWFLRHRVRISVLYIWGLELCTRRNVLFFNNH